MLHSSKHRYYDFGDKIYLLSSVTAAAGLEYVHFVTGIRIAMLNSKGKQSIVNVDIFEIHSKNMLQNMM